jgi:hypothetical protein
MPGKDSMKDEWVPLQPFAAGIEDKLEVWFASEQTLGAFCCLCGEEFGEENMIPQSNTHNCEAGLALRAKARREEQPACSGKKRRKP